MEFIFIILSWMILLVPGFDDSVPPTGDKIFKIETSPDIVQSITVQPYESFDFWGFDIELKQNSTGNLDLKIPKNLPTPASNIGFWAHDPKAYVLDKGVEVDSELIEDLCYYHYTISIDGRTDLEIVYTVITAGSWQLYTPIQFEKDNPCYNEVFYKKLDSPLKQFKSGIPIDEIQCKDGLVLVLKYDDSPACLKPETFEKLYLRGWGDCAWNCSHSIPDDVIESEPSSEPDYNFDKTITLIGKKSEYNLDYSITSGIITDMQLDCNSQSLVLSISSDGSGVLTLQLQEQIIGNVEEILVDEMKWDKISLAGNTVIVSLPDNAETIQIKGTYGDRTSGECS